MHIIKKLILLNLVLNVNSYPVDSEIKTGLRFKRLFEFFSPKKSDSNSTSTTEKPTTNNPNIFGTCGDDDKLIYIDDTRLESNNSTLGGMLEIYLDSPFSITCVKFFNQMSTATGAELNLSDYEGGQGHKFIKVKVQGKYGYGIHFNVQVWGKLDEKIEKIQKY